MAPAALEAAGDRLELHRRQRELEDGYRAGLASAARRHGADPRALIEDPAAGLVAIGEAMAALEEAPPAPSGSTALARNPYGHLVGALGASCSDQIRQEILRDLRPALTTTFSYAVPSDGALARIAALAGDILEIGAGGGYWARCLAAHGAQVLAFDRLAPPAQRRKAGSLARHFPIHIGGPREALAAHPRCPTLLLCWPPGISNRLEADAGAPPRFSPMGEQSLAGFKGANLVFVGSHSRSFGSPAFFARLDADWQLVEQLALPNLGSWRDSVHIYRRRR